MPKCTQHSERRRVTRRQPRPIPPLQPPLTNIRGDAEQEAESASDPLLPCISSILELRSRGICAVTAASTQAGDCQGGFAVGLVIRRQVVSGVHFPRAMLTEAL